MKKKRPSPFLYEVSYFDVRRQKWVTCVGINSAAQARATAIELRDDKRPAYRSTDISIRKYKLQKVTRV